jgi:hypothetical protein
MGFLIYYFNLNFKQHKKSKNTFFQIFCNQVLSNDDITTKLCTICKDQLESFDQFKKKCLQSDTILKLKNDIKEENDVVQKIGNTTAAKDVPTKNERPLNKECNDDFIKFENIDINEMDADGESVDDDILFEQCKKTRTDRKKWTKDSMTLGARTEEAEHYEEDSESDEEEREFVLENGLKKYVCRICKKKKFILLGPLKKHEKKHAQKKLIICDLCGAVLSCAKALKVTILKEFETIKYYLHINKTEPYKVQTF